MFVLGIDVGKSGAIAWTDGNLIEVVKMPVTERDTSAVFEQLPRPIFGLIEKVHSMPGQGVKSMFTFGQNYGFLRACLIAHKIPFNEIRPQVWQKALGCLSKGDKNVTKQKAQQLYPHIKCTHAISDALLIATYCFQEFNTHKR